MGYLYQHNELPVKNFAGLSEDRKKVLLSGVGSCRGAVPMLCFTEMQQGRDIAKHKARFGSYGIVVTQEWVREHKGDRVVYIGSQVGKLLAINLGVMLASTIVLSSDNDPIFQNHYYKKYLDLFCYFQPMKSLVEDEEYEWRVVGNHGFLGGGAGSDHIPLPVEQIKYIFVNDSSDVSEIQNVVNEVCACSGCAKVPDVIVFPDNAL
ncbi:MAG: hypothetical protein HQL56_09425 [Magnetococcales bacterium]|nr:hypothetical protein [Magnetococcales bacterium]